MKKTANYNLPLYEVNDIANLTDGYNAAMNLLDADIKTVSDSVASKATAADLNSEITRAKSAEATLTTNLNSEIARAKSAEATLTTNLNSEIARAKSAEADKANIFATRSDLANSTISFSDNDVVIVSRYSTSCPIDPCFYTVSATKADTNSVTLKNGKYANIVYNGVVKPNWLGAIPGTDSTAAIQKCIDVAQSTDSGFIIDFENNQYSITSTLAIKQASNNITFKATYADWANMGGLKAAKNNITMLAVGESKNIDNRAFGINFDNFQMHAYDATGVTILKMFNCSRGYIKNSIFAGGKFALELDSVWDYSFINLKVYNNERGLHMFSSENGDCNAIHIVNSHFESNNNHVSLEQVLDCEFSNSKFENTNGKSAYEGAITITDSTYGVGFVNNFFSAGANDSPTDSFIINHGRYCIFSSNTFIGNFTNMHVFTESGVANVISNNTFFMFDYPKDQYIFVLSNCFHSTISNNSSNKGKIKVFCNYTNISDNVLNSDTQTRTSSTIDMAGGTGNYVSSKFALQSGCIPVDNQSINGVLISHVSGSADYDNDNTLTPANVIICDANSTISFSAWNADTNRNHIHIIANGHTYTFNGTSYSSNTEWAAYNGNWVKLN